MCARWMPTAWAKLISTSLLTLGLCFAATGSAQAALLLDVDANGELLGARNVQIGDKYYDVSFVDGTCAGVFGACDQAHFFFKTDTDAQAAAQALLDQVLLDGPDGDFDSQPELTRGCEMEPNNRACIAATPHGIGSGKGGSATVLYSGASNSAPLPGYFEGIASGSFVLDDLTVATIYVWARWSDAVDPPRDLPEPASLGITALALAALALRRRQGRAGR